MACKDCLINCPEIVSDQCVQYTGPEIPLLGLCPGDPLSKVEANIIAELLGILDGTGIEPANVTVSCEFLQDIIGVASPSLSNILQMLITASCTLRELITEIESQIEDNPVFDAACLTGLPTSPTRDDILQAAVNLVCSIKTTVDAIPTTYVKNSDLTNLVTQIVNNINGGGGTVVQNNTKMIPYTVVAYFGPLSNFDASGIGITSLGFEKIYICNGSNGTPDLRGRVVVGAIQSVPGGTLDAAVDPAVSPSNPNWALNAKNGSNSETLNVNQMPSHVHGVSDPGHTHHILGIMGGDNSDNNNQDRFAGGDKPNDQTGFHFTNRGACVSTTANVSILANGGGQPHNNIQPSLAGYYIMYIP
jgi:microcystin-dependent protein